MKRLIAVVGATGVGKTRLGIELAKRFNGEVVNADAIQLYNGLDVASAKATLQEMDGVVHHLLGFLDPGTKYSVRDYRDQAMPVIDDILERGKVPIIVGGTLYYVQALLYPSLLDDTPGVRKFKSDTNKVVLPPEAKENMYEYLQKVDPETASRFHPSDHRKIERGLQVYFGTGMTQSEIFKKQTEAESSSRFNAAIFWLSCDDTKVHDGRLDRRVDNMMEQGLWQEARDFIVANGLGTGNVDTNKADGNGSDSESDNPTSGLFQAMGYKEFLPVFQEQEANDHEMDEEVLMKSGTMEECVNRLKLSHKQYVRRQLKWIKSRLLTKQLPVYKLDTSMYDGTEENWGTQILGPAETIADWFLAGNDFESGQEPPGHVRANIKPENKGNKVMRTCEKCGVHVVGEDQWRSHLKSKKHRYLMRKNRKVKKSTDAWKEALAKVAEQ